MAPYAIRDQKGTPTLEIRKKTIINYSIIVCRYFSKRFFQNYNWSAIILGISATTMYAFMSLILLRHNQRYFSQVNKVVFVLYTLRILSGLITIISMYRNQDALISAYQQLDSFDTRRKSFKEHDYTAVYNVTIFLILSVCFLVIGIELIYYYIMEETLEVVLYDSFSNGFQFLIHLISLLYFELYVVVLTNDFKFVKLIIEKLNHSSKKSNQAPRNAQSTIRAISFMYDDLCKGASHINEVFSFTLFALISLNFMEVLLGLYLLSDKNTRDAKAIFWTIFYALQQFSILIPPGTVEAEVMIFNFGLRAY